jgi:hypothetical protein
MRRVASAIALFFLSPLVAEFLLGDFGLGALYVLIALAPMYGGGAILIREVVRRTGRGWPSIVLLALAFGLLEEGFTTMSLFNPDYLDAHLLDQGFVPALGISIPWTIFVLTIHTIWSISVPVALVEEATDRRTAPWLGSAGLVVASVLFGLGVVIDFLISYSDGHYLASWPKLLVAGVVVVLLVVAALRLPRRAEPVPATVKAAPSPWIVLVTTLALGGLLMVAGGDRLPLWLSLVMVILGLVLAVLVIGGWSRLTGWGARHRLAVAAGGLFTYAWHGFTMEPFAGGGRVLTPVSHVVLALGALALVGWEARRLRRRPAEPAESAQAESGPVVSGPLSAEPG